MEEVGKQFTSSMDNYFNIRSKGIRSTKNFFQIDTTNLTSSKINESNLDKICSLDYTLYHIHPEENGMQIRIFVEFVGRNYVKGNSYYELTKPEIVQDYKKLLIMDNISQQLFGGDKVRELLGLPDSSVKVNPANFNKYSIFVQSTSVNRKLVEGTRLITLH